MRQFEEKFGKRVLVSCHDLSFNLQGCVAENEEGPTTNVSINEKQTVRYSYSHKLFLPEQQTSGNITNSSDGSRGNPPTPHH